MENIMPRHLRIEIPCNSDFDMEKYQEIFLYLMQQHEIKEFSYSFRIKNTNMKEVVFKIYHHSPSVLKCFKIDVEMYEFVGCEIDLYGAIVKIKKICLLKGEIHLSLL